MSEQDAVDDAAAQLLIALAFLAPQGTDIKKALGAELLAYKKAIEARATGRAREAWRAMDADIRHGKGCPARNTENPCSCGLDAFSSLMRGT